MKILSLMRGSKRPSQKNLGQWDGVTFLGAVHQVSNTSTISILYVCMFVCKRLLIGQIHTKKLFNTAKQLLLDSYLQEIKVRAFISPQLFDEL